MKRLIRKAEPVDTSQVGVEIGDTIGLDEDPNYKGLTMNDLSRPNERDGAVLIDSKNNVIHWGVNGETHEELLKKFYDGIDYSQQGRTEFEIDSYVTPGIYLRNFLGHETIILYNDDVTGVENVITGIDPNIRVFVDDWNDGIQRIAKRLLKKAESNTLEKDIQIGEEVNINKDSKYQNTNVDKLSLPYQRDGAVIVDTFDHQLYWGLNGETHSDIVKEIYNIDQNDDDSYRDLDDHVAYGIYLKDFLGHETIILYDLGAIDQAVRVIKDNRPDVKIYTTTSKSEIIERLAKRVG